MDYYSSDAIRITIKLSKEQQRSGWKHQYLDGKRGRANCTINRESGKKSQNIKISNFKGFLKTYKNNLNTTKVMKI